MSTPTAIPDAPHPPTQRAMALLALAGLVVLAGRWWWIEYQPRPGELTAASVPTVEHVSLYRSPDDAPSPAVFAAPTGDEPIRLERKLPYEAPTTVKLRAGDRIDINTATTAELQQLPGIGVVLAERIAEARRDGKFQRIEDLRRVSGIGTKKLEAIRPFVRLR